MSTKISLTFQTKLDINLLSAGLKLRYVRILTNVCFKTSAGWTEPYEAIVDTGSPVTVIPQRIHLNIHSQLLYKNKIELFGIGQSSVQGQLSNVTMSFHDKYMTSPPIQSKVYFLDDNSVPFIIGYEDALTELRFISDYPKQLAYFEFP